MKRFFWLSLALLAGTEGAVHSQTIDRPYKAYLVSDAHLDTQWNWDVQTTIKEHVKNTIERNLSLLERYPDYVFNFEGGVKYAWMKEYYPLQYERMKQYVQNGRWHISGSTWDANDVLVPSSESVIRNFLLGQTFFRKEFGKEGTDVFLPDCFGFGWTLPSLAAHCGLIGFSTQKLNWRTHPFYGNAKLPFTIGLWQGIDGQRIMFAHGHDYTSRFNDEDLSESDYLKEQAQASPLNAVYHYYGTGDIGGSPSQASVRSVEKGLKGKGPVEVVSATSDQLYKDYLPYDQHPELPVFNGELTMDVHGTGCYTSQAAMKLYNRQNELLGDAAERAALAADWLNAAPYPGEELTEAWRRFIYHQFHDDLTGTSIPRAYEFSWNDELLSLKQFAGALTRSVAHTASLMDTRAKGTPVVIYNANGHDVNDMAEVRIPLPRPDKSYSFTAYGPDGKQATVQHTGTQRGEACLLVEARVPANGYAVYDIRMKEKPTPSFTPAAVGSVENSIYRIAFDPNGDITSIVDKRNGKEIVQSGRTIRLALFEGNLSRYWPAWEIQKETIDRTPTSITGDVNIRQTEDGQLRKTVCVTKRHGQSEFRQYIRLYEGSRADRVDFYNEVDWQSTGALLKAEFPLNLSNEEATYDLGLGSIRRGNNTPTAYEVYGHQWADLTDKDDSYGVSILNDCKYGWDKPDDHTLRLTLLHTPTVDGYYTYQERQDLGRHVFTYSLTGHEGALDKPATVQKAAQLNQPLKAFRATPHKGKLGKTFSFARTDNGNVAIKALKRAETSDEYVIRLYETGGKTTQNAVITLAGEIASASEADGTEKAIGPATFSGNRLEAELKPYSLKTYKVRLKKTHEAAPARYAFLPLEYNRKCFSRNHFEHEADFEGGYSYAAELLPNSILDGNGTPFRLGDKEAANGMTCQGDTLSWSKDHSFNRIYLLAASTDRDHEATFRIGQETETVTVPCYSGFIGQWGHSGHTVGFLKPAEVAYVGTHRHSANGDEAYEYTYFFKIGLDIPKGTDCLVLPDNEKIALFAATLADERSPQLQPACELFRAALPESGPTAAAPDNLLRKARVIACSGEVNQEEQAAKMADGDPTTKWCDTNIGPNFVDFDLGSVQTICRWKMLCAGQENSKYITRACFLQGKNAPDEEWRTIDQVTDNNRNVVARDIEPASCRYLRLLVTQSGQENPQDAARIYELEVYGQ